MERERLSSAPCKDHENDLYWYRILARGELNKNFYLKNIEQVIGKMVNFTKEELIFGPTATRQWYDGERHG